MAPCPCSGADSEESWGLELGPWEPCVSGTQGKWGWPGCWALSGPRRGPRPACNGAITQKQTHSGNREAQFLLDTVSTHLPSPDTTGPVSAGPYHPSPDSRPPVPGLCLPGHLTAGLVRVAWGPGPCTQGALWGSSL